MFYYRLDIDKIPGADWGFKIFESRVDLSDEIVSLLLFMDEDSQIKVSLIELAHQEYIHFHKSGELPLRYIHDNPKL